MIVDWKAVQSRLKALGFNPGPIDGLRGPVTDAAIVAFKSSIGFRARAYYGPLTHAALFSEPDHDSKLPWMQIAASVRGLHETQDRKQLSDWFAAGVFPYDPRSVPWCGAYVATCIRKGINSAALPENPLGARNWLKFGDEVDPGFGAVLVFWRGSRSGWQGHVGFYHGEDDTHFHVNGGNQSNAVTIARIAKSRLLGARWPRGFATLPKPIFLTAGGVPVTTNEA